MIAIPSVSRPDGTTCSTSDMVAIMTVGAMANPATNRVTPISGREPTK